MKLTMHLKVSNNFFTIENIVLNNEANNALESFFQTFGMVGRQFTKHSEIFVKEKPYPKVSFIIK
jgi:hypothetical protein